MKYTCDGLSLGSPLFWAIYDEQIHFDMAFNQQTSCELYYFRSPLLLSPTNQTNWVTNRYPMLLRQACIAGAYSWRRNIEMYQIEFQKLTAMAEQVSVENDMFYRGAEIDTETP